MEPRRRAPVTPMACESCRRRKAKCDGCEPCGRCSSRGENCIFAPAPGGAGNTSRKQHTALATTSSSSSFVEPDHQPYNNTSAVLFVGGFGGAGSAGGGGAGGGGGGGTTMMTMSSYATVGGKRKSHHPPTTISRMQQGGEWQIEDVDRWCCSQAFAEISGGSGSLGAANVLFHAAMEFQPSREGVMRWNVGTKLMESTISAVDSFYSNVNSMNPILPREVLDTLRYGQATLSTDPAAFAVWLCVLAIGSKFRSGPSANMSGYHTVRIVRHCISKVFDHALCVEQRRALLLLAILELMYGDAKSASMHISLALTTPPRLFGGLPPVVMPAYMTANALSLQRFASSGATQLDIRISYTGKSRFVVKRQEHEELPPLLFLDFCRLRDRFREEVGVCGSGEGGSDDDDNVSSAAAVAAAGARWHSKLEIEEQLLRLGTYLFAAAPRDINSNNHGTESNNNRSNDGGNRGSSSSRGAVSVDSETMFSREEKEALLEMCDLIDTTAWNARGNTVEDGCSSWLLRSEIAVFKAIIFFRSGDLNEASRLADESIGWAAEQLDILVQFPFFVVIINLAAQLHIALGSRMQDVSLSLLRRAAQAFPLSEYANSLLRTHGGAGAFPNFTVAPSATKHARSGEGRGVAIVAAAAAAASTVQIEPYETTPPATVATTSTTTVSGSRPSNSSSGSGGGEDGGGGGACERQAEDEQLEMEFENSSMYGSGGGGGGIDLLLTPCSPHSSAMMCDLLSPQADFVPSY